jgi:HEAT repeat protein
MRAILADVVAGLALTVALLATVIIVLRAVVVRRRSRQVQFRLAAEHLLAEFLVGNPRPPLAAAQDARVVLLRAALDALLDLRGGEHAKLVALLEELGYGREAISGLSAGRLVVRRRAAETLAAIAGPPAVPALIGALADRDVMVRMICARTLAEIGGEQTVPLVVSAARRDMEAAPGAAAAVILALARRRPDAIAPLLGPDAPARLRGIAMAIVGELRLAQHARALQDSLAERDFIAASAARGLGQIGEAAATAALAGLALDERPAVSARAAAVTALGSIGDPAGLPVLERLLAAANWPVQAAAAAALARLGPPGLAALQRAARSGQRPVRELAEAAASP